MFVGKAKQLYPVAVPAYGRSVIPMCDETGRTTAVTTVGTAGAASEALDGAGITVGGKGYSVGRKRSATRISLAISQA